jgi:hypothetical protein
VLVQGGYPTLISDEVGHSFQNVGTQNIAQEEVIDRHKYHVTYVFI